MNLHRYPVSSQTIILGNNSEEDVFEIEAYHLKLNEENVLLLHNGLYAHEVRCSLVFLILVFSFDFRLYVLISYTMVICLAMQH